MFIRGISAALAILIAGGAQAEDLRPIEAGHVDLGRVSGVAYYTVEPDGYHVVATMADGESMPVRIQIVLAADQTVVLSVPGAFGERGTTATIGRRGSALTVRSDSAALD